jgi:23S rRNA (adenine2503-C2)-methyltransferase
LSEIDIPALAEQFVQWGFPGTHAANVLRAYYENAEAMSLSPDQIGRRLHGRIVAELLSPRTSVLVRRQSSDGTVKLLLSLGAENGGSSTVEAVLMPSHREDRAAGCISSQVGCAMGCDFCASTKSGLERNLTAGEIVEQFLHLRREAGALGRRLVTVVFMGMGEPLLNYENVVSAIRRIADPGLGAVGWRQVTVSTVGIVPGIERLMREGVRVQLAVSLHAPDDQTRAEIIPTARRYKVAEIVQAAHAYQEASGRVTNVEYCMLAGVNDSPGQARLLADLLRGRRMHVNLIPHNPIGLGLSGRMYRPPGDEVVERFVGTLREGGVVTHIRQARGQDIEGACGQLRQKRLEPQVNADAPG